MTNAIATMQSLVEQVGGLQERLLGLERQTAAYRDRLHFLELHLDRFKDVLNIVYNKQSALELIMVCLPHTIERVRSALDPYMLRGDCIALRLRVDDRGLPILTTVICGIQSATLVPDIVQSVVCQGIQLSSVHLMDQDRAEAAIAMEDKYFAETEMFRVRNMRVVRDFEWV